MPSFRWGTEDWPVYGSLMTDVERLLADPDRAHLHAEGVVDGVVR
ncbi:hypothetical protein [Streptomyces gibsoniae]|uniref:Uncharacterized protein n=1 Tax=Streptomyces gibsoniae TaxID=3075529 RepID=A0ABU2TVP5_9ACTN|nr:hypothetical protein [Streptomyces sp. DSM 41699]MDT0464925.1 hypothetical protein [Streptomyces sp. DSM 41699]